MLSPVGSRSPGEGGGGGVNNRRAAMPKPGELTGAEQRALVEQVRSMSLFHSSGTRHAQAHVPQLRELRGMYPHIARLARLCKSHSIGSRPRRMTARPARLH